MLKGNATGFFHLGKFDGVWWILDPNGNAFISKGVDHVSYEGDYAPSLGYSPYNRVAMQKYGSSDKWSEATIQQLHSFGFNTIGAWSSDSAFTQGMPYTIILDIAATAGSDWLSGKLTDYFSSRFESTAYEIAERICQPRKDDPYLLGYFTDNELRWSPDWRSPNQLLVDYLSLPSEAEGKRAAVEYLRGKYLEVSALNRAWNTSFSSFDDILQLNVPPQGVLESDALGFLAIASRRYFQVCHDAIKKYDPNHLILGCRYAIKPPDEALKGCIGCCDVISINNYNNEPPLQELRNINALTGLPVMITEFSFKALDSGLPNTKGAGNPLGTQEERAYRYEKYVRDLISAPYVVGYHWFEYTDEPAEGRFDGENSNYGLVDIADNPWAILVTRATAINLQVEILHLQAGNNTLAFFVSPNGDDRWSGRFSSPSPSRTDGPFATISRAQDAILQLRASKEGLPRAITVLIGGGTYFLREPLLFTANDSGTDSCNISYISYPGETPILSGGRPITGWRQVTVGGKQLWAADVPEAHDGKWSFSELWVNGQRRIRARYPNKGYLHVAELPDVTSETPWTEGQRRFRFYNGDLASWRTTTDAEVVVMNRWVESRLPIVSIDEVQNLITFKKSSTFRLDPGDLYYVENAFDLLDSPGEWYLNRTTGILYYLPMSGEDMTKAEVIAPVLSQLMRLEGKPEAGQLLEHIIFRGLTFAHTEWTLPPEISGYTQAAFGVPGAIYGIGVCNCSLESCTFEHLGTYAIELSRGCCDNIITGCDIHDLGAGGIKIGEGTIRDNEAEQTHGNEILDCYIHDGGHIFHSAVGIWIGQSFDNLIAHNWIHDFYYTGISIGWTWGYGPSLARGNVVEFNEINNIGVLSNGDGPILSDMGGIYTLGARPGTVIRFNLFHDIAGFRYGGWGIYFDEGSTQVVAECNVVYGTTHGGFHQHYGRENIIRNNIFAFGRDAQIQRTQAESHLSFTFEHNIVYWRDGDLLAGRFDDSNFSFDYNLYWREGGGEIIFGTYTLNEWRERGMDLHSMIADPLFVEPDLMNFTLRDSSPALSLGFKPIDLSNIGPRVQMLGESNRAVDRNYRCIGDVELPWH